MHAITNRVSIEWLIFSQLHHHHHHHWCRRIFWLSSKDPSLALSADFTNISMHAIATDPCAVDRPCLYVQLDTGEEGEIFAEEHDEEGDQDPEELSQQLPELRLIPSTASALEALFQAFCDGAVRNPDSFAEEEGQGSLFFDQASALASVLGATALEGGRDDVAAGDAGDDVGDDEMERFEDADEEDSRHPASNGAAS
jgi:chloride channel, nucleotide-sensitive, 1A